MPRTRTSSDLELLIELDRSSPEPLHRQLERSLRGAVRDGRLARAGALPSSRAMAGQLGVSRGIVVEAYEQLVAEGYLASRPGGATRVADGGARSARAAGRIPEQPTFAFDFRPGRPDVSEFPRAVWLRSLRRVLGTAPSERLTYLGGRGVPELGTALAAYLNRVRGTAADPADVIPCAGFAQGLAITLRALRAGGARIVAVEDPSDPEYRATIRDSGLDWVAVPVDRDGIVVDRLATTVADAVVVTAAHQYPTGGVLPPERRADLVAWATDRGATIIEDDYDAEFRYDREPIGAVQGLAPERVVYAGSASKILAPGLRLGWLLAPQRLTEAIVAAKQAVDMGSAALDLLTFADILERGELDRHLRRMRPIYRGRRDSLIAALARWSPELRPEGASAGLHLHALLPADLDEAALIDAAGAAGIGMTGLTARRVGPGLAGLILGYGAIAEGAIDDGIRRLAEVIAACRTTPRRGRADHPRRAGVTEPPIVLAVYGTLRRGERNGALLAGAAYLGTGVIAGRLVEVSPNADRAYAYPALVGADGAGPDARDVVVELYALADVGHLARVDALEAFDPADEAGSEYVRRAVAVRAGPVDRAWAYAYNGPQEALGDEIGGGDWVAHRRAVAGT